MQELGFLKSSLNTYFTSIRPYPVCLLFSNNFVSLALLCFSGKLYFLLQKSHGLSESLIQILLSVFLITLKAREPFPTVSFRLEHRFSN